MQADEQNETTLEEMVADFSDSGITRCFQQYTSYQ